MDLILRTAASISEATEAMKIKMEQSVATLIQATAQMETQAKEAETKQAEWQDLVTRVRATLANAPHLITLDVSGTTFRASKETLLAVDGSYFHAMLGSGHWKPDAGNAYFLDLHGPTFDRVLIFLKTGKLWLDGLNKCDKAQLLASMEYLKLFGGDNPPSLEWDALACSRYIKLDPSKKTATKTSNGTWSCVLGALTVTSFQLRLDKIGTLCYVGLQPSTQFRADERDSKGYYIHTNSGNIGTAMGISSKAYASVRFVSGDIITVQVTSENKIHFEKNGQDLGAAFTVTDPAEELYPVVCMYDVGAVTILE
ncbi:Aste57867_13611 [Aphanomyces stellatus]|uniref:Aste57867_13611 protein n=1 Tax=Aphanomyces stellatus TaxID=120398 RepID=A0A485KYL0_9STRA|nr:hypothetical protein As57867_013561 [Aphanomyces stellatus]VFT90448.1 Aste57867_13611 [Aphanomyces stellatus]